MEILCSKAAAKQRAGRAGRVQPGTCYRLVTRSRFGQMPSATIPEIRRVPLESTVLQIMSTQAQHNPLTVLAEALDPPDPSAVHAAVNRLVEVGAIKVPTTKDGPMPSSVSSASMSHGLTLTALGQHLSRLPVDAPLGKMMIFGALFGVRTGCMVDASMRNIVAILPQSSLCVWCVVVWF